MAYVDECVDGRLVVKISGLGKMGMGVTVCDTKEEARAALYEYMVKQTLGDSGKTVIIEERISGQELSIFGLSDGKTVVPLTPVRDHKRIFDHDQGPNTGGMGAFGPPEDLPPNFIPHVTKTILQPTIDGMMHEGNPYVGVLFVGLMQTARGLQVLEYNCRFGNPEALVLMSLLESDLVDLMEACLDGTLSPQNVRLRLGAATAIVAASPQYPAGQFPLGLPITGLDDANNLPNVELFHHGTAVENNQYITVRGRVLAVTAVAATLQKSLDQAYSAMEKIHFDGMQYRKDIGQTAPISSKSMEMVKELMEYERPYSLNRLY